MAVSSGPGVVNSGLVFAYDMANYEKSWRGEPTTNLYDFSFYQAEGGHTATRTVGDAPGLSTSVVDYHTITTSGSWIGESARLIIWPTTALAASTTFRVSFWARVTSKETTTIKSAFYGNAVNNSHSLTTSWQRFSYSSTTHSAYRALEFGSDDGAITFQIAGIQWESKSVQTPYVKTSRSNTQAILDLTGQNTITANSLTYSADGTFSFVRASSNYLNISGNTNTRFQNSHQTLSTWVNISSTGPNGYSELWNNGGNQGMTIQWRAGAVSFFIYNGAYLDYPVSVTNALNTWMNITCVIDNVARVMILYKNGILVGTSSQWSSYTPPNGIVHIGGNFATGNGGDFTQGNIPTVQLYNRALTADEVFQNFAATRSRYGI